MSTTTKPSPSAMRAAERIADVILDVYGATMRSEGIAAITDAEFAGVIDALEAQPCRCGRTNSEDAYTCRRCAALEAK